MFKLRFFFLISPKYNSFILILYKVVCEDPINTELSVHLKILLATCATDKMITLS